jgi:hypothetical protein
MRADGSALWRFDGEECHGDDGGAAGTRRRGRAARLLRGRLARLATTSRRTGPCPTRAPRGRATASEGRRVAGSQAAEYHPDLRSVVARRVDAEFVKGRSAAAYSGFEAVLAADGTTSLGEWLHARDITAVDVVGLATDTCGPPDVASCTTSSVASGSPTKQADAIPEDLRTVSRGRAMEAASQMRACGSRPGDTGLRRRGPDGPSVRVRSLR